MSEKKLLIVGAGAHSFVVKETAVLCGYNKTYFLDDSSQIAIGTIADIETFRKDYTDAFVSIGNNAMRRDIIIKLKELGYYIPTLIHPRAYISPSVKIGVGTLIEAGAMVNSNVVIGDGAIIGMGSIVDHDANIGNWCHVNVGAIVQSSARVDDCIKIDSQEVIRR